MKKDESETTVGWMGAGVMGAPMAGHLLRAGYRLRVFTRTAARADELLQAGAKWAESPRLAAAAADIVCLMVGTPQDVEQVVLGPDGILPAMQEGATLIDFTTSSPSLARRIAEGAAERGVAAIDAPVSGGDVGAREARLSIMVGGAEEAVARVRPLLERLGRTVVRQGGPGMGQHTKMMNQIVIASGMIGVCEGLVYAERAGLDLETALASVGGGAAASWSLANYVPRMLKEDFAPGFRVDHFVKDMEIALEECRRMHLELPGLELARSLYRRLIDEGWGRQGTQSLVKVVGRTAASS
jgi:3-hydroxyisobutyrate dehydrogenase